MKGKNIYTLTLDDNETTVIAQLLAELEECPIPLSNDDYVNIFRAIYNEDKYVDGLNADNFVINYE